MSSPSPSDGEPPRPGGPGREPWWVPRERRDIRGIDLERPLPASWLLVGVLVAVHLATGLTQWRLGFTEPLDALLFERDVRFRVAAGGQYLSLVEAGEVWRLWTSVLLHVDLLHLALNSVSLLALGRLLEPWVGGLRLLAWFCTGGLVASMMSYLAGLVQSDGASGGAFALLGAAVVLGFDLRKRLPEADRRLMGPVLWIFVAVNILLSLLVPFLDLVGHLAGLLTGVMLGFGVGIWRSRVVLAVEAMWVGFFAGTCALGWWLG